MVIADGPRRGGVASLAIAAIPIAALVSLFWRLCLFLLGTVSVLRLGLHQLT
jgi:hypothetical protein